jgi:L-threonylcarbamoyladenylate synthase
VISLDGPPRLLRAGAVPRAEIEELIGPLEVGGKVGIAQSPGQHRRHYAPAAVVRLAARPELASVAAQLAGRVGALIRGDTVAPTAAAVARLPDEPQAYARGLYAALRDLEDADCAAIVVEQVPGDAEWDAIRDRLTRAAAT